MCHIFYFQSESLTPEKQIDTVSLWVGWSEFALQTASENNEVGLVWSHDEIHPKCSCLLWSSCLNWMISRGKTRGGCIIRCFLGQRLERHPGVPVVAHILWTTKGVTSHESIRSAKMCQVFNETKLSWKLSLLVTWHVTSINKEM